MKRIFIVLMAILLLVSACTPSDPIPANVPDQPEEDKAPATATASEPLVTVQPTETLQPSPSATQTVLPAWLAYISLDGNVMLIDAKSGEKQELTMDGTSMMAMVQEPAVQYSEPAWSSDGRFLAVKRSNLVPHTEGINYTFGITVFDLESGERVDLLPDSQISDFSWQPGTHVIAYSMMTDPNYFFSREGVDESLAAGIMAIDLDGASLEPYVLVEPQGYSLNRVQFSPDGLLVSFDEILYMEGRGNFAYVDLSSGEYTRWERSIGQYEWSLDGESIVYDDLTYIPSGEERIFLNDRYDEDEQVLVDPEDDYYAFEPHFSADGEWVLFKESESMVDDPFTQVKVIDLATNEIESMVEEQAIFDTQWSPDAEWVVLVMGPYDAPQIVLVNVYDGTEQILAEGWSPVWKPLAGE